MADFVCPGCQADIESDLLERTGRAVCPFCSADLSGLNWTLPQDPDGLAASVVAPTSAGQVTRELPAVPGKSRIQVVESTADRLVIYVPGGGKQSAGLGCFALFWNLFMCIFTPPWFIFDGKGDNGPPMLFLIPFLGLFWVVGLGMAYFWLKMKYERTFVLLEKERLVVQKILFNRKKVATTMLGPDSRAALVESYSQNDVPVYRVEVNGTDGAAKFGTALADDEKDWLVDRINEFLGVAEAEPTSKTVETVEEINSANREYPTACEKCGAPLTGTPVYGVLPCQHCGAVHRGTIPKPALTTAVEPKPAEESYGRLTPDELAAGSPIVVDEAGREELRLHFAAAPATPLRWIVPLFTIPFAIAWYAIIFTFIGGAQEIPLLPVRIGFTLFTIPFLVVGLFPFWMGLFALVGRTSIKLNSEKLTARWHIGRLGYSKAIPVESITSVRVERGDEAGRNQRVRSHRPSVGENSSLSKCCIVRSAGKMTPLTLFHDETVARQVAELLRTRLAELGHTLNNG